VPKPTTALPKPTTAPPAPARPRIDTRGSQTARAGTSKPKETPPLVKTSRPMVSPGRRNNPWNQPVMLSPPVPLKRVAHSKEFDYITSERQAQNRIRRLRPNLVSPGPLERVMDMKKWESELGIREQSFAPRAFPGHPDPFDLHSPRWPNLEPSLRRENAADFGLKVDHAAVANLTSESPTPPRRIARSGSQTGTVASSNKLQRRYQSPPRSSRQGLDLPGQERPVWHHVPVGQGKPAGETPPLPKVRRHVF